MKFEVTRDGKIAIIQSKVEKLDASNSPELKAELVQLNKEGINQMVIDLSASRYCDSSGLSAILTANRLCKDTNGHFVLCGLQTAVYKLIQISQLDKVLSLTENAEEAVVMLNNQ